MIRPRGPLVMVNGGGPPRVRGVALATTPRPPAVTITPKFADPVPPMLAATRWSASARRQRSMPPYGNAPLVCGTIAQLYRRVEIARRPIDGSYAYIAGGAPAGSFSMSRQTARVARNTKRAAMSGGLGVSLLLTG